MSQAFLRGLDVVEAIGAQPQSVSDLARRTALDKAVVSRLVAAAEDCGWIVRAGALLTLGPRALALGLGTPERSFAQLAADLAHTVAGVTGFTAQVGQLAGGRVHLIASMPGRDSALVASDVPDPFPLTTAMGVALVAQTDDPSPVSAAQLSAAGEGIVDRGETSPGIGCIARAWHHPNAIAPTAFSIAGRVDDVLAELPRWDAVIAAAVAPGATPASIVAAAAGLTTS